MVEPRPSAGATGAADPASEPHTDDSARLGPSVAVVDIGSGTVKLLVVRSDGSGGLGPDLARASAKTRLIAGNSDRISDQALADTGAAFEHFTDLMAPHQPASVAVVGTEAARLASNADRLDELVERHFGCPLEILSGQREAELSFCGAVLGRELSGPVTVLDVGAGSTEFAVGTAAGPQSSWSLPVGGRLLTDSYLLSDPHRPEELSSALTVMELHLDDLRRELPTVVEAAADGTVIGVGAVNQIGAVEIGSTDPDFVLDGQRIEKEGVEEVFRALATETAADRVYNPGLLPEHVDDIVGAMCVLVEFMRQFGVAEVMVSERGLRHGLAAELLAKG